MVELRPQRLGVRNGIISDHNARRLHQASFDRIVKAEIRDDPFEQRGVGAFLARRREGCGREIEAALDAPGLVDTVQPLDPARRFIEVDPVFCRFLLADLAFRPLPVGVMRLIVDNDNVLVRGQLD